MEWHPDWEARRDATLAHGLPCFIRAARLLEPWNGRQLLVLDIYIAEILLLRSHAQRDFDLHLSIAFDHDLDVDLALAAMRLHERWANRRHTLRICWMGCSAYLDESDPLMRDPDLRLLHSSGSYSHRDIHVSL